MLAFCRKLHFLDAQRAVRFIRYHADKYQIDPDRLGIMGFSAGGMQAAGTINICRNRSVGEILKDAGMDNDVYQPDGIDATEMKVAFAGLIYPMLGFSSNVPMMYAAFDKKTVDDEKQRQELLKKYNVASYVQEGDIPQFLCIGTKDTMVTLDNSMEKYMAALQQAGVMHQYLPLEGALHGFGLGGKKYGIWVEKYLEWVQGIVQK